MRIITDTLTARHEREARQHERRQRLPAVQRVHLLRCRSGAPSLPVACEDVSWMDARCNTFGMAFTLEVEWNWSIGDLMLYTSRMARVRPNTASAKELAEMKQDHVRGGHDEVWPAALKPHRSSSSRTIRRRKQSKLFDGKREYFNAVEH